MASILVGRGQNWIYFLTHHTQGEGKQIAIVQEIFVIAAEVDVGHEIIAEDPRNDVKVHEIGVIQAEIAEKNDVSS